MKAKILFLTLCTAVCISFLGCRVDSDELMTQQNYGSLEIGIKNKAIDTSEIVSALITVSGRGMTDITKPASVTGGAGSASVPNIPVGKNRVITIEARNSSGDKIVDMVLRGVTDINPGVNNAEVSWNTTALGNVFFNLLNKSHDISSLVPSEISSKLPSVHASLVNASKLADDIIAGTVQAANSYKLSPATIAFTPKVTGAYTVQVTDPASAVVSDGFSAGVKKSVTGIAPGTWKFYIIQNNNKVYFQDVTVSAGESLDLGDLLSGGSTNPTTALGYKHPDTGTYSAVAEATWGAADWKLGAHVTSDGDVTFAIYSKNANKVLLEIYADKYGSDAAYDYWLKKGSDNIWRGKVKGIGHGTIYAFRCWGPNWTYKPEWKRGDSTEGWVSDVDSSGNRFNPNKVLYDPYTREMTHDPSNGLALAGAEYGYLSSGNTFRGKDSGKYAPKGYVISDNTSFGTKPQIPAKDAIIYEAHVRGITKHRSSANLSTLLTKYDGFSSVANVPNDYRGTYKGAVYLIPYLKGLGINTIELLPVHETDNDSNPDNSPGGNFWGYMTFGYFAPDRRYSYDKTAGGPTKEFKEMIKAFHAAGMEVYLDVVYNHTGEGGTWKGAADGNQQATLVSMRGLDNSTYYSLVDGNPGSYWETTGCGNNMQCDNPTVRKLILDSLTYWIDEMGIDGFRFDLATTLGRVKSGNSWNYNVFAQTLTDIAALGKSKNVEMIAESWDTGSGSYQVGNFPDGWGGWNGYFRDVVRSYIGNKTPGAKGYTTTSVFYGTMDNNLFHVKEPSINFICAHDGFTLADLSSYGGKGNYFNDKLTWPFGKSDGGNDDENHIGTGITPEYRRQRIRNYFTFQMFSAGIPMIVYGDEFGRTQNGNNNPYNLDSVATWNNYDMINTKSPQTVSITADVAGAAYVDMLGTFYNTKDKNGLFDFARYVMKERASSNALRQVTGQASSISYFNSDGSNLSSDPTNAVAAKISSSTEAYYVMMNMWDGSVNFKFPAPASGQEWIRIIDTGSWTEGNSNYWTDADADYRRDASGTYEVGMFTITVLKQVKKKVIPVSSITLNKPSATISINETITLTATIQPAGATNKNIIWTSENNAIATVTGNSTTATVKGIAKGGPIKITAKTESGNHVATCNITVKQDVIPAIKLTLNVPNWVFNGGAKVYAWVWDSAGVAKWIKVEKKSSTQGELTISPETKGFKVVRFASSVSSPDWSASIWNQSGDMNYTSGTTTYTVNM